MPHKEDDGGKELAREKARAKERANIVAKEKAKEKVWANRGTKAKGGAKPRKHPCRKNSRV